MGEVIFEARCLHKAYGGLKATDDLSLELEQGKIHALIGPNGAGKTTALAQLSGELQPNAGSVHYRGQDITAMSMPDRAKNGIARSFQITAIFDDFTVEENVAIAVQAQAKHHFSLLGRASSDRRLGDPTRDILARLRMADLANRRAADLAHGQKRQLEIAMALATNPAVLLLDEPMAGMGPVESAQLAELLEELRPDYAILLVEHDMNMVFRLADIITVLVNGRKIASGTAEEIKANADVQKAYLEEGF